MFADPEPVQGGGLGRATMPETAIWSAVMGVRVAAEQKTDISLNSVVWFAVRSLLDELMWSFGRYLDDFYRPELLSNKPRFIGKTSAYGLV